jgi:hypothetical protein
MTDPGIFLAEISNCDYISRESIKNQSQEDENG